jgi:hypothetical protein
MCKILDYCYIRQTYVWIQVNKLRWCVHCSCIFLGAIISGFSPQYTYLLIASWRDMVWDRGTKAKSWLCTNEPWHSTIHCRKIMTEKGSLKLVEHFQSIRACSYVFIIVVCFFKHKKGGSSLIASTRRVSQSQHGLRLITLISYCISMSEGRFSTSSLCYATSVKRTLK